jgi:hypothetical protein
VNALRRAGSIPSDILYYNASSIRETILNEENLDIQYLSNDADQVGILFYFFSFFIL